MFDRLLRFLQFGDGPKQDGLGLSVLCEEGEEVVNDIGLAVFLGRLDQLRLGPIVTSLVWSWTRLGYGATWLLRFWLLLDFLSRASLIFQVFLSVLGILNLRKGESKRCPGQWCGTIWDREVRIHEDWLGCWLHEKRIEHPLFAWDLYIIWKRKERVNFWVFKRRFACFGWLGTVEKLLLNKKNIFWMW